MMVNKNFRKSVVLLLLVFSLFAIVSSVNADTINFDKNNFTKDTIEEAANGTIFNLDPFQGSYDLSSKNNINIINNITIQSSDSNQNVVLDLHNTNRAFYIDSGGFLTLINITIINGQVTGDGGAIYIKGGATLTGCKFINNKATEKGGAIYNNDVVTLIDCNFNSNSATQEAGAIYNSFSAILTAVNSIFTNNSANTDGGAIFNTGGVNLNYCTFSDNTAKTSGGAIYNLGHTLTVKNSIFNTNKANSSSGGAILSQGSSSFNNCSFTANFAYSSGGAIYNYYIMDLDYCTFTNNRADSGSYGGGAICNNANGYNLIIRMSNFTGNSATNGGAIYNYNGTVDLTFSNLIENSAINGGAIYNGYNMTIFASNVVNNSNGIYIVSSAENTVINCTQILNGPNYNLANVGVSNVNADFNWWGSNNPQGITGVTLNNYYVMSITTNLANLTCSIDDYLTINYNFVLNGTNKSNNAVGWFNHFTVNLIVNNKLFQTIDGRYSSQFEILLKAENTTITTQLHNEISTVKYKASKISTVVVFDYFKPLYNRGNIIKVSVYDKSGKLFANKTVALYVNGKLVGTAKIINGNTAMFNYTFKTRKTHKIEARLIEDGTHASSNSKILSVIPKDKSYLTLSRFKAKFKKKAILKATLKTKKNKVMAKRYVKFYANKKYIGKAKTNKKGIATLKKKMSVKGNVKFTAIFTGDKSRHDSVSSKRITVK